jgi:ketosteroid isomerase-like protein
MYREDGVLMPPGHAPLQGRAAIESFYREMCLGPAKITAFKFEHLESTVAGETAYDVGTYRMTIAAGPGKSINDTGKYSVILKKTGDDWKIAYLIFNSDLAQSVPGAQKH